MQKTRITVELTEAEWEILKPILKPRSIKYELCEKDDTPIDWNSLTDIKLGVRIANILRDGQWDNRYTPDDVNVETGVAYFSIKTIGDLKNITKEEFLRHRFAGAKSWDYLSDYILTL